MIDSGVLDTTFLMLASSVAVVLLAAIAVVGTAARRQRRRMVHDGVRAVEEHVAAAHEQHAAR